MSKLKIGVVMDPVDKINIDKDTTFVLMLEAQQRGHEIYFMEVDDLFVRGGDAAWRATAGWSSARATPHYQLGEFDDRRARRTSTASGCAKIRRST